MNNGEDFLKRKLKERAENGLMRSLSKDFSAIDFCANDYLGFAKSSVIKELANIELTKINKVGNGSTGSRLITGNHPYIETTENFIANFHQAVAGLIFNSGYDANVGLLSSIPQRGDTIITDELIHASLIDGARLSHADRFKFKHNDIADLEIKLKNSKGSIYVVVESVYSMDGDQAPLVEITNLCKKYSANLIVDEAHATGVFGKNGRGLVCQLNLESAVFARIITFSKAIGSHGAIILGSENLRRFLINFARSFIYTTAAPLHQIATTNATYQVLTTTKEIEILQYKIRLYNQISEGLPKIYSTSAIQTILLKDNDSAKNLAKALKSKGFEVKAILSPTVPKGKERLRICLHCYNSDQEIKGLVTAIKNILN